LDRNQYHLVLLAKNLLPNLLKIVTNKFLEGFYYKPRIDLKFWKISRGIIALSACLNGEISSLILEIKPKLKKFWKNI
jgi:DNA polymerase-3 subunit alpha